MPKRIFEAIITAITIAVVSFLFNFLIFNYFGEKGIIRINTAIQIENKYETSLDILNFSDKVINDLQIRIPTVISMEDIIVNQPVNISKNKYIGENKGTVLAINDIGEKEKIHMVFLLNKKINPQDILIKNNNNFNVEYYNEIDSPIKSQIYEFLKIAIIYGVIFGLFYYWTEKIHERRISQYMDNHRLIEKYSKDLKDDMSQINISLKNEKKRRLLLTSRLNEYKKELSFWRNTIRKLLYNNVDKNKTEEVIKTVTSELKTFQTRVKDELDFDELILMAKIINKDSD